MRTKKPILILVVMVLAFVRTYTESYLVQLGLDDLEYAYLRKCTIAGCFLKFQYQVVLDILSFGIFFLFSKQYLSNGTGKALLSSGIFVALFMLNDIYVIIGGFFGLLIPDFIWNSIEPYNELYWSLESYFGMLISIVIMALASNGIIKREDKKEQKKA